MTMTKAHWSVARAKASLSQVLEDTRLGPQVIEKRGKPIAVVLSLSDYQGAIGDPAEGSVPAARWRGFLARSQELRERGGAALRLPRRTSRASPFGPAK